MEWYEEPSAPDQGEWWWAVEHRGHPAFYLRALLPGDFAPGRLPLPRHVRTLTGEEDDDPVCGTCAETPVAEDLDIVERATGRRGFLTEQRAQRQPWPKPTDPASCWLCSDPRVRADQDHRPQRGRGRVVKVCKRDADFLARRKGRG